MEQSEEVGQHNQKVSRQHDQSKQGSQHNPQVQLSQKHSHQYNYKKMQQRSIKQSSKEAVSNKQRSLASKQHSIANRQSVKQPSTRRDGSQKNSPVKQQQNIQWETTCIDGKFYLADPSSLQKLKALEQEIQIQKHKLQILQHQNHQSDNHSFYSYHQHYQSKQMSEKSHGCVSELNQSSLIQRKHKAQHDLHEEQEKYRQKLERMAKRRNQIKKQMLPAVQQNQNRATPSETTKKKPSQNKPDSVKKSQHKKQPINAKKQQSKEVSFEKTKKESHHPSSRIQEQQEKLKPVIQIRNQGKSQRPNAKQENSRKSHTKSVKKSQGENIIKEGSIKDHQPSIAKSERKSQTVRQFERASNNKYAVEVHEYRQSSINPNEKVEKEMSKKNDSVHIKHQEQLKVPSSHKNDGNEKSLKSNKVSSVFKNQPSAKHSQHQGSQRKEKSHRAHEEHSQVNQTDEQESIKSKSRFSEKRQTSRKSSAVQNDSNIQEQSQTPSTHRKNKQKHLERNSELQKSHKDTIFKGQQSNLNQKKSSISESRQIESDKFSVVHDEDTHLRAKNANESVTSSIKGRNQLLDVKKEVTLENRSVQWSERPVHLTNQAPQASFQKSKKVYEASEHSKKHSESKKYSKQQQQEPVIKQAPKEHNQKATQPVDKLQSSVHKKKNSFDMVLLKEPTNKEDMKCIRSDFHEPQENSSIKHDKRNRSFIIHQKGEPVILDNPKSHRSMEKRKGTARKSAHSGFENQTSKKSQKKEETHRAMLPKEEEVTKTQIQSLNNQVKFLQEKLRLVEERQMNLERQGNKQLSQQQEKEESQQKDQQQSVSKKQVDQSPSEPPMSPLHNLKPQNARLRVQNRLNLSSSITQYNSIQERRKKQAEDDQKNEKQRLKDQIAGLKRIVRDMQMEKIKSIDGDGNTIVLSQRNDTFVEIKSSEILDKWKQLFNSNEMGSAQQLHWNSDILKLNRPPEQTGKILRNSPQKLSTNNLPDSPLQKSPRRKLASNLQRKDSDRSQRSEPAHLNIESDLKPISLKRFESQTPSPKRRHADPEIVRQEILQRLDASQRNFHKFMQFSKNINEQQRQTNPEFQPLNRNNKTVQQRILKADKNQQLQSIAFSPLKHETFQQNSSMIHQKVKLDSIFKRLQNDAQHRQKLEQELPVPQEICFGNWQMPSLPETPNQFMTQQELLSHAKKTYQLFGIETTNKEQEMCMKKYKNCVMFTFSHSSDVILWHYSGKFYIGGWRQNQDAAGEGQKDGHGIQYIPQKHVYKGQFWNGKKNGNGLLKNVNGNIYDGQWVDGIKSGRGKYYEASTGTTYDGQWKDGKKDGFGVLRFSQKEYFQGTFVKSVKHGYGSQRFVNGDLYKGQYSNGRFHGKGRYLWANSSSYEGDFMDGARHGQGTWKSCSEDGDIYTGQYVDDKKCGFGRYVWANGCIYEGYFKNDVKHGEGRLSYPDGKEIKGNWDQGTLVSTDHDRKKFAHQQQPLKKSIKMSNFKAESKYNNQIHCFER